VGKGDHWRSLRATAMRHGTAGGRVTSRRCRSRLAHAIHRDAFVPRASTDESARVSGPQSSIRWRPPA
jgi:hypothetical protein